MELITKQGSKQLTLTMTTKRNYQRVYSQKTQRFLLQRNQISQNTLCLTVTGRKDQDQNTSPSKGKGVGLG